MIEFVEKEWKNEPHVGEMPLDIVAQVIEHGDKAIAAIDKAATSISSNKAEFARLQNDMHCYREFAYAFNLKVKAAKLVLDYQWGKDIKKLEEAIPLMEQSLEHYRKLVELMNNGRKGQALLLKRMIRSNCWLLISKTIRRSMQRLPNWRLMLLLTITVRLNRY